MPAQAIRPSQFITTYGPGSILEGPDGPRVVLALQHSGVFGPGPAVAYAISEAGLSRLLPEEAQIVRIPSNAERLIKDSEYIYVTDAFPRWSLCVDHSTLYHYSLQSTSTGCAKCKPCRDWGEAWRRSRREAIRFVMACPAGHLDEVNWQRLMKHTRPECPPDTLRWEGGGGAIKQINIVCPTCGASANLGTVYSQSHRCTGRHPERKTKEDGCTRDARITQRGAANLYVSEVVTGITIPELDTPLHQALASSQVLPTLETMDDLGATDSGAQVRGQLERLASRGRLPANVITDIAKYDDDAILRAVRNVLQTELPDTPERARVKEFIELQRAATHGHPAQPSTTPGAPPLFEVVGSRVRQIPGPMAGHPLRVTPVSRLRVVMVHLGYRRLDGGPDDLVRAVYQEGENRWLPGVELHGEGVFIDLAPVEPAVESAPAHFPLAGEDADSWMEQWRASDDPHRHPVFVWWHTLAHRLILGLSVDSGYSSAAVRERVYTRVLDPETGAAIGGVLLYTAQPGGDGTLGGLIALVPRFQRILEAALRDVDACSNDPLCGEERYTADRANGAACYACQFVSETSCELRNMHLDRNVLRHNHP